MPEVVYLLCAITSVFAAVLLLRSYRKQRTRLLMWSSFCFVGLAVNNVLLIVDLMLVPNIDFGLVRSGVALAAILLLLFGLIWESA